MISKLFTNTQGTAGGPGGRDRTLAVKNIKITYISLVIPKYWGKQIFTHGRFPEVGQKQKTEKNTQGTAGGPGGRDRTLAIKSQKIAQKSFSKTIFKQAAVTERLP